MPTSYPFGFMNRYNCRMRRASKPLRMSLAMVVLAGFAQGAKPQASAQAFQKVMQPYVEARMFMGSVLVARQGKTIFNHGYGISGFGLSILNSHTTLYNLFFVSK